MSIDVAVPTGNFKGYDLNTRSLREPDSELTKVGPGTPCGEYLRRYWHPIAMTGQIDEFPLRIRRFGEDLVLFRDKSGRYGCLHLHCSHRNTSLEFGIVEREGIRCCYHGWLYDVDGTILETPGEPANSRIRDRVAHGAYPTVEYRGLVFAYFGPPEEMPTFPFLDHMDLGPADEMVPFLIPNPCNWLQTYENSFDPYHTVYLHTRVSGAQFTDEFAVHPEFEIFERPYGYFYTNARRVGDKVWIRFHDHLPPNFSQNGSMFPDAKRNAYFLKAGLTRWVVPVDDENNITIAWRHFIDGYDPFGFADKSKCGYNSVDFYGQTDALPYEERQRKPGDYEAWVGQGAVSVHEAENLGETDKGVAMARRHHREQIRALQRGERLPQPTDLGLPVPLYGGDSVLTIPGGGEDDRETVREVCRRVAAIYMAGDGYRGDDREAFIVGSLRKLEETWPAGG